ncbi:MAG: hypothetical protein HYV27_21810 [Candidatus Hydrogenedentes bacterium]|nr:hypothetical protein [Candidatus Hydrogenedentota bacterium]
MIAKMTRVEVVFLRSELEDIVPFLQEQGVMHLEDVPLAVEEFPGFLHRVHLPAPKKAELDRLQELATRLKETLPLLSRTASAPEIAKVASAVAAWDERQQQQKTRFWHRNLRSLGRRKLNVQDNIELVRQYGAILTAVAPVLAANSVTLGVNGRAMLLDGYTAEGLESLEKKLVASIGPECSFVKHPFGRNKVIGVISHPKEKGAHVSAFLEKEGVMQVNTPEESMKASSVSQMLHNIERRIGELQSDLDEILTKIQIFSEQHGAEIGAFERFLNDRIKQLDVTNKFAQSKMVAVIHGWVPAASVEQLAKVLRRDFGDRAALGTLPMDEVDLHRIPTLRDNHPIFKPFELIMGFMKPPTYGSFDPTWLVAVSFIIFYGFILGDAGYGLILIAIGAWVKSKWGHIKPLYDGMTIFQWMGASSVLFGLIYLEIFGNFVEKLTGWPALFHRAHETDALLYMGIAFGAIHIPLSLILGIREGYHHHHTKHAEEKLGMFLGLIALATAVASGAGYFPLGAALGYFLAALLAGTALFYLVKSMGVMAAMGVMEVIGLTANVLSYSRLMALGIASIAFADIANDLPNMLGGGPIGYLIGIPMALAVHVLNIGIGVFSPTIHSLRLNFVEFLPKFYAPEGKDYEPFRKELVW